MSENYITLQNGNASVEEVISYLNNKILEQLNSKEIEERQKTIINLIYLTVLKHSHYYWND